MNILAAEAYVATPLFEIAGFPIGWADIAVVAIMLIVVIINIAKGFLPQIAGFVGLVGSIILAATFSGKLLEILLNNTGAQAGLSDWLAGVLNLDKTATTAEQLGLPEFVAKAIESYAGISEETNIATLACDTIARYILLAGCFLAIFLVARLALLIFKAILKGLVEKTPIGIIDKLLGLVLGLIKGLILINVLSMLLGIMSTLDFMEVINAELAISQIYTWISQINILAILISLMPWFAQLFGSFGASTTFVALGLIL